VRVQVRCHWLPKAGNGPHEYEDAFWPARSGARTARVVRCAIADGATEASFSGLWAAMLVQAFGRGRLRSGRLADALAPLQSAWSGQVSRKPLPWYAEEKLRSGAFSSLLGITLTESADGGSVRWSALAVGDSCLFVVRQGRLISSFPVESSEDFNRSPYLIPSTRTPDGTLEAMLRCESGPLRPGDDLYLMTDALACWFLARQEEGGEPWATLGGAGELTVPEDFAACIADERVEHRLRNDDVTMLQLRLT
jgi:Protein phosphatase 2C